MEQPTGGAGPADAADGTAESLDRPLPEGVRHKVVALVSDAFGGLTVGELPSQLRQYARFTPSRRAKFAGNAMAAALESDPVFRRRIGERIGQTQPELAEALESGAPPAAADPVDVAAAAYVLRPAGWVKLVAAAGEEVQRAHAERADEETRRELERLREELDRARGQTRADTERLRSELEAARKETDSLHRKLRSALSEVKRGEAALRKAGAEADTVRAESAAQVSAAESETRRLKARLAEAEASVEAAAGRPGRGVRSRTCACGCSWTPCSTPRRASAVSWRCPRPRSVRRTVSKRWSPAGCRRRTSRPGPFRRPTRRCSTSCWPSRRHI